MQCSRGLRTDQGAHSLRVAPDAYADELDGSEIVGCILVVPGDYSPELLDRIEEALDEIALSIEPRREAAALLAV